MENRTLRPFQVILRNIVEGQGRIRNALIDAGGDFVEVEGLNLSPIHLAFARLPAGMIFNNPYWPQIRGEIR